MLDRIAVAFEAVEIGAAGFEKIIFAGQILHVHDGGNIMVRRQDLNAFDSQPPQPLDELRNDLRVFARMVKNQLAADFFLQFGDSPHVYVAFRKALALAVEEFFDYFFFPGAYAFQPPGEFLLIEHFFLQFVDQLVDGNIVVHLIHNFFAVDLESLSFEHLKHFSDFRFAVNLGFAQDTMQVRVVFEVEPKQVEALMIQGRIQFERRDGFDAVLAARSLEFRKAPQGIMVCQSRNFNSGLGDKAGKLGRGQIAVGVCGMQLQVN